LLLLLFSVPVLGQGYQVTVLETGHDPQPMMVESSETIRDIKERIALVRGYAVEQQILVFDGSRLDDHGTVADHGIEPGNLLYLTHDTGQPVTVAAVTFDAGTMDFTIDRMILGTTQIVEQSPDLTPPTAWSSKAVFPAYEATTQRSLPKPGNDETVFYRVREQDPRPSVTVYEGYELFWHDEFEGPVIDSQKWVHQIGDGTLYGEPAGWGNAELQLYTDSAENSSIVGDSEGNSVLLIEARRGASRSAYSSAKLVTEGLQSFRYGRIEARIRLPYSQGAWPAFWMLGVNKPIVEWPGCGEIDIMEMLGGEEQTIYGTAFFVNEERKLGGTTNSLTRPDVLSHPEHRRRRLLARQSRCHLRLPDAHVCGLGPRLHRSGPCRSR
jgi:hypothetical protein